MKNQSDRGAFNGPKRERKRPGLLTRARTRRADPRAACPSVLASGALSVAVGPPPLGWHRPKKQSRPLSLCGLARPAPRCLALRQAGPVPPLLLDAAPRGGPLSVCAVCVCLPRLLWILGLCPPPARRGRGSPGCTLPPRTKTQAQAGDRPRATRRPG